MNPIWRSFLGRFRTDSPTPTFEADPFPAPHKKAWEASTKMDGWVNWMTGLGLWGRDKTQHYKFQRPTDILTMDWTRLQALYHYDPLARKIVETWPRQMFRRGWDLTAKKPDEDESPPDEKTDALPEPKEPVQNNKAGPATAGAPVMAPKPPPPPKADHTESKAIGAITKEVNRLQLVQRMFEGMVFGGLFGGAIVILGVKDGRRLDEPLDEKNVRSVDYATMVDRRFVQTQSYYTDPIEPNYGQPMIYRVFNYIVNTQGTPNNSFFDVHESRVIRFEGASVDLLERIVLQGWSHSVLQAPIEEMKRFMQTFQSASHLLSDASQGVYKLKGLVSQIGSKDGANLLQARMQMVDMSRSVARALLLDSDGEDFQRIQTAFTSIPELLDRFMQMLSMTTGIPVTILMGRSAAGMNATGDSDFRAFYDEVASRQVNELEPKLQKAYKILMLASEGPTKGEVLDLCFEFRALWHPTDEERAKATLAMAQADSLWIQAGVMTPEECATSRWKETDGTLQYTTKIDHSARRDYMEAGLEYDPAPNQPTPDEGASSSFNGAVGPISTGAPAPVKGTRKTPSPATEPTKGTRS